MSAATEAPAGEVALLQDLSLQAVREMWEARYGAPPKLRSRELLALMLGFRIQAEAQGGLDAETRRALRRPSRGKPRATPTSGTRLVREWGGRRHEVTVAGPEAFIYQGESHASLSEIARKITGVRWNGPRFFGLRAETGPS